MPYIRIILFLIVILGLGACMDTIEKRYWVNGKYFITDNPGKSSSKTLYLKAYSGGIGRVDDVTKVGHNQMFIWVESCAAGKDTTKSYWIINKTKDDKFFNANDITEGPFNLKSFKERAAELKIEKLSFEKEF